MGRGVGKGDKKPIFQRRTTLGGAFFAMSEDVPKKVGLGGGTLRWVVLLLPA